MASKKNASGKKTPGPSKVDEAHSAVEPSLHQQAGATASHETQRYGEIVPRPHGLSEKVAKDSVALLNQSLADTMTLRDMYKKHHWQVVGPTFDQLHLMYDKHFEAQVELVDAIAERIQVLGGISLAMAADVAEATLIPRLPRGREPAPVQLSRLIDAHTHIIKQCRASAEKASDAGDAGTDDLLVSEVLRTNELQVWFLSEHLVAASPV
jgi:starvation-inducible DNA-binding protein